jgi:hypothetical protein
MRAHNFVVLTKPNLGWSTSDDCRCTPASEIYRLITH